MKPKFYQSLQIFSIITLTFCLLNSCKKHFDEPPVDSYPVLVTNTNITAVKALHTINSTPTEITDSLVFEAIVVSSDEAGNFYKQLIIQDDSAGIELRIEMSNLYADFPVGRKVYVKCKGLFVGDYQGNHQLTFNAAGDRIPQNLLPDFVVGGAKDQTVVPKLVNILDLKNTTKYRNMLVELNNVQFDAADTAQTYADAAGQASLNRIINDCDRNTLLLRSSGYATFASELTKTGNGTAIGVHTNFGTDAQFYIRDPSDLNFTSTRCTQALNRIGDIRALYTGTPLILNNKRIGGIVISDRSNGNITSKNVVIQDSLGYGITLRYTTNHSLNLGDKVEIDISGGSLEVYNGLLQINNLVTSSTTVISTGNNISPRIATIADILANVESWESTLVQIQSCTISGTTFGFSNSLSDPSSQNITLYTSSTATFSGSAVPTGQRTVMGIIGQFDNSLPHTSGYQILLRNLSDVN